MYYVKVIGSERRYAAHTESRDHAEQMFHLAVAVLRSSPESTAMVELCEISGMVIAEAYLAQDKVRLTRYEEL